MNWPVGSNVLDRMTEPGQIWEADLNLTEKLFQKNTYLTSSQFQMDHHFQFWPSTSFKPVSHRIFLHDNT